jgi:hypothetical protein
MSLVPIFNRQKKPYPDKKLIKQIKPLMSASDHLKDQLIRYPLTLHMQQLQRFGMKARLFWYHLQIKNLLKNKLNGLPNRHKTLSIK